MPTHVKDSGGSRERILEAAERLFALNGFQCTTISQLACEAKGNLAAVNYYFGSKRALIERVVERRLPLTRISHKEDKMKIYYGGHYKVHTSFQCGNAFLQAFEA